MIIDYKHLKIVHLFVKYYWLLMT